MKKSVKKSLRKLFLKIYSPFIIRKEKFIATRMWRKGVRECIRAQRDTNGPRFYLWFDLNTCSFFPIVLEPRPKHDWPSMRELVRMGKIKAKRRVTVRDMERDSFYYTPSSWGAKGCDSDNALRIRKYHQWLRFYMEKVSEPMQKLRRYQP